jgi:hypothetical protein
MESGLMTTWLDTLATAQRTTYSQTGEEGILEAIFAAVGTTNQYLVDIGAGNGVELSNTRIFLDIGWKGKRFDSCYAGDVHRVQLTAENVCAILAHHEVPREFDLLSLDIDGIDWYVLRSVLRTYVPRVFVCEINHQKPYDPPLAVTYDPALVFKNSDYYGATLGAYCMLAESRGYVLVHCQPWNAFFVRRELLPEGGTPRIEWAPYPSWPPDPEQRPWYTITDRDLT